MGRNRTPETVRRRMPQVALGLALLLMAMLGPAHAAETNWTGSWDTRWSGGGARLTLEQTGDKVTGSYPVYGGEIEGHVEGNRLVGTWTEPQETGPFEFILSDDGDSFMGRVGKNLWWTGSRIDPTNVGQSLQMSQATPQDTLRAFLIGGDAIKNGQLEFQDDVIQLLVFPEGDLDKTDQLKKTNQFWLLLDQFSIDPSKLTPRETQGDHATITMSRHDGRSYAIAFLKRGGNWFIEMPTAQQLRSSLDQLVAAKGGRLPTESHVFKLETPRDTMEAFLDSMRAGPGGLDTAIATLDLSEMSPVVRDREAVLIAEYLNEVLARVGEVVFQEIPNDPSSEQPYIHFVHPKGEIAIAPVETDKGVKWKFTPDTLRSIRTLYAATEDIPPGGHVLPYTAASTAPFFRMRSFLSDHVPWGLEPLGPLERWQWAAMAVVFLAALLGGFLFGTLANLVSNARGAEAHASRFFLIGGMRLLVFGLIGFACLPLLGLPDYFAGAAKTVSVVAMIAGAIPIEFWIVDRIRTALDRSGLISQHGDILASLLVGLVKMGIIVGSFLLLAEALNIPYGAALAGLGIGGLAVALAARTTLENIISGFILFADRPLAVGDFCRFGARVGTVEKIGIRSTSLRTLDRTLVSVPNADFVNMHLENFGRRDRILLHKTIALRYETTPDQLRYVLTELRRLLVAHPKVSADPARVRFAGFTAHALELEIFAYVMSTDWSEFLAIREDIFLRMMDVIDLSGTAFALPAQTLYLNRDAAFDAERAAKAAEAVDAWRRDERLPFPNLAADEIARIEDSLAYPPEGAPAIASPAEAGPQKARRAGRPLWPFARGPRSSQPVS